MARLHLDFPEDQYYYTSLLTVRVTDINAGNHLGNDSMISMISEARARFLFEFGVAETERDGTGIIVTDLATTYRAEAHARDQLLFEVGVMDFNKYGGDIIFRITRRRTRNLVAMAKQGFVFFNYKTSQVVAMPDDFRGDGHHLGRFDHERQLQRQQQARFQAVLYQPFFITGDMVPNGSGGTILAGGYYDINNKPIVDTSVAGKDRQFFSDSPDGTSLLTVAERQGDRREGQYRVRRGAVRVHHLGAGRQDRHVRQAAVADRRADPGPGPGHRQAVAGEVPQRRHLQRQRPVDHLRRQPVAVGHPPVERGVRAERLHRRTDAQFKGFSKSLYGDETRANPYNYGHLPEVTVNPDGTGSIKKHYCMGRISHELVQVMGDNRTVLMGDDATNSGYFVFVADKEKDLSSGTLYVAKVGAGFSVDPAPPPRRSPGSSWVPPPATRSARWPPRSRRPTSWTSRPPIRRRQLHQGRRQRPRRVDQAEAGHGKGRRLPGNPPLRRAGRRLDGLHQDGRHDRQPEGQDRLLGAGQLQRLDGRR
jgi:acyl-CoA thioesterase FadM